MTITIRDLATELTQDEQTIQTYVDQLIDIDGDDATIERTEDLTNSSGRIIGTEVYLTGAAADAVRLAVAVANDDRTEERALADIAEAAARFDEWKSRRDREIQLAVVRGVPVARVAEASGLSVPRIYQIRDGRY